MMEHAAKKVREAHLGILKGRTEAAPYRKGQETGCDYCRYRHICGFDVKIPGYHYRDIGKMNKEEAVAAMKAEAEEDRRAEAGTERKTEAKKEYGAEEASEQREGTGQRTENSKEGEA